MSPPSTIEEIGHLIAARLRANLHDLRRQFAQPQIGRTRYAVIDELLPRDLAQRIHEAFPPLHNMRLLSSFRERKYTSKSLERMQPLMHNAIFAFQTPDVIDAVSHVTG